LKTRFDTFRYVVLQTLPDPSFFSSFYSYSNMRNCKIYLLVLITLIFIQTPYSNSIYTFNVACSHIYVEAFFRKSSILLNILNILLLFSLAGRHVCFHVFSIYILTNILAETSCHKWFGRLVWTTYRNVCHL